jgi:hypothetical protein
MEKNPPIKRKYSSALYRNILSIFMDISFLSLNPANPQKIIIKQTDKYAIGSNEIVESS